MNLSFFLKSQIKKAICYYFFLTRNDIIKSVYFESKNKKYSDNQRSISEALYNLDPTIIQIWNGYPQDFPSYVRTVSSRLDVMKAMAQSKAWVIDLSYGWKPKSIFNIATWHGDRGFKKILYSIDGKYPYFQFNDEKAINGMDLYLAGSKFGVNVARLSMRYNGEIQLLGCPRNDKLVRINDFKEHIAIIKEKLNIKNNQKVYMYAPTFRDSKLGKKQPFDIDLNRVTELLNLGGEEWICLVRSHSLTDGFIIGDKDSVIDVSSYPDMTDLLLIADLLITDYSSCCCDFALTNKPCVITNFNPEFYKKECRSFSVKPIDAGFLTAYNQKELEDIVMRLHDFDFKRISDNVNKFYGTIETGESSIATAKRILEWMYIN